MLKVQVGRLVEIDHIELVVHSHAFALEMASSILIALTGIVKLVLWLRWIGLAIVVQVRPDCLSACVIRELEVLDVSVRSQTSCFVLVRVVKVVD